MGTRSVTHHFMLRTIVATLMFGIAATTASAEPPTGLQSTLREAIDAVADALEREPIDAEKVEFGDNLGVWLLSRTELEPADEAALSSALQKSLASRFTLSTPPERVQAIWSRLLKEMPARMRPAAWNFALHVVDSPQAASFSVGGGQVMITAPELATLEARVSHDGIAFVLAHQLGHLARGHCTQGFLREKYDATPAPDRTPARDDLVHRMMRTQLASADALLPFIYTPGQQYEADVFALHLCRNAGFDQTAALDVLRLYALQEEPELLPEPNRPAGAQALGDGFAGYQACAVPAKRRLRQMRHELLGIPEDPSDRGIVVYNRELGTFGNPVADGMAPGRAVIFVHGMEGELSRYHDMAKLLARQADAQAITILGFRYPDDDSLAKSALLLQREVARVCGDPSKVDFVCHSAGGLVFRYYHEILGGKYRQVLMHGTPQKGSQLARLRTWLELGQIVRGFQIGVPKAVEASVLDGSGQISYDLEPDSLFLQYLNRQAPRAQRTQIYRGQILTAFQAAAARLAVNATRTIAMDIIQNRVQDRESLNSGRRLINSLNLPDEIYAGDGLVALASAELAGAEVHTSNNDHLKLTTAEANLVDGVARILSGP